MSELKCCPFCGGEARLYGNPKPIGTSLKHYQVAVCTNDDCGCRTSPCETVEDAIYKWNRRATIANIVEKLEEEKQRLKGLKNDCIALSDSEVIAIEEKAYNYAINIVKQEINNGN